ncbi:MAG: hypothetical protein M1838_001531 [Thelocarpon superellum]|nr:MAG: hypothetical protein M1838_001531 [Thelocarpon superellum]
MTALVARGELPVDPRNVDALIYFSAAMGGLMALFVIGHGLQSLQVKSSVAATSAPARVPLYLVRLIRSVLLAPFPGFTSTGHAVVVSIYVVVNVLVLFTNLNYTLLSHVSRRFGWVATANLALLFFLALKNTPLGFLTAYSYERLNVLHQIAGYTTILLVILHAVIFTIAGAQEGALKELISMRQQPGIVAGASMLVILVTALVLRKRYYELFYLIHLVGAALILIGLGQHRSDISTHTLIIVIFCATIWLADRLIRFLRTAWNTSGNRATLTPLPYGGTRVILSRPLARAQPGLHAQLWMRQIRKAEMHPFTIVSTDPVEFVIAAHDGFTGSLHRHALDQAEKSVPASIDGPYGTLPDFAAFDKVVLIAGGSGASFAIAIAMQLLRAGPADNPPTIDVVWAVREHGKFSWFAKELSILQRSPRVTLALYCTHPVEAAASRSSSFPEQELKTLTVPSTPTSDKTDQTPRNVPDVLEGRPNVSSVVEGVVRHTAPHHTVIVSACGPSSLMRATRQAVTFRSRSSGPGVELHCEEFGW